ncbi:MAG: hyalin, partial [Opitutae bacterium]
LYFSAQDQNGSELWKSDGSESGTVRVKDIYPGSRSSNPQNLANFGGTLYFTADDGNGYDLWKSDGTKAGTIVAMNFRPLETWSHAFPKNFTIIGNTLYFSAEDPEGRELWKIVESQ